MTPAPVRAVARLAAAGLWLLATLGPASGLAQTWPSAHPAGAAEVLDVPYLPQSVLLCGGAALAMVERWWGRRGVQAEDFAALVRPELGGIRTTDLDSAARARGWNARALRATPALVQQWLRDSVPVIALIEVRPARYHFVVIVGWSEQRVVFHDPAGAPNTAESEARFLARWAGGRDWALVVRPAAPGIGAEIPVAPSAPAAAPADSMPCRPWLDRALDAAAAGDLTGAALLLESAARACPGEPLVTRERAAIRFRQGRHAESISLVTHYLAAAPRDTLGWQLLATSRYLTGDPDGALEAWNETGQPIVDLLRIDGLRDLRFRQVATAAQLPHGSLLTPTVLALARRRLAELPGVARGGVGYQPVGDGLVEVRVQVAERPLIDPPWRLLAAGAIRAVAQQEAELEFGTRSGAGERWSGAWRWEPARQRASMRVELPLQLTIPGVLSAVGGWERMAIGLDALSEAVAEESHRSAGIGFEGWLTPAWRPALGLRLERWSDARRYLAVVGGLAWHAGRDRLAVSATVEQAVATSGHSPYRRQGLRTTWTSALSLQQASWSARLGYDGATAGAPMGRWPVAGRHPGWAIPLRAEPALLRGVVAGRTVGRGILHGGVAGDLPMWRGGPVVLAAGAFLDGARIASSADRTAGTRAVLDAGLGVRIGVGDGALGTVRIDWARRVVGGRRSALTVGLHRSWPPLRRSSW